MTKMTDEELGKAFRRWQLKYIGRDVDEALRPFLNDDIRAFTPSKQGWLRRSRMALFLSAETVAKNIGVSRATYSKYEEGEENGTVTLVTLARAAEAMGCELVYALRPKNGKFFSRMIWAKLLPVSLLHPWLRNCDQRRRADALVAIASRLMEDPKFRKKQAWSQRANG